MDREHISLLVGRKVSVRLNSAEARGVEILATLDDVRDDGIALSEIGELGMGPTMFVPWDSFRRVRERPPGFRPSWEELELEVATQDREFYELREVSPEEVEIGPPTEHREPSARTLERVVPIAQRRTVGEITVALVSLELHGDGLGVLRYLISQDEGGWWDIPEPELVVRDVSGRVLPWSPRSSGASGGESDGDIGIEDLPSTGELEVEVLRLVFREWSSERGEEEVESYGGPWTFRFSI